MTFRDLQKAIESQPGQGLNQSNLQRLRGLPFWIFDKEQHRLEDIRTQGQCCFWHVIKPPQKDGRDIALELIGLPETNHLHTLSSF